MKPDTEIRILHVDDDKDFLELAKTILSEEGPFNIETAASTKEALDKLQSNCFDIIISDYEMPQQNGLEFFKLIREKGFTTPFILFTGKGREEIAVQALNLGIDRYINKHDNPRTVYTELSVSINQLFDKAQAKKRLWESEERFKQMVTNSKDLIMLTGTDGAILYLSPSCRDILGYEPAELIGQVPWIIHPDDLERVQEIFQSALTTQASGTLEYRIVTKQGQTKWVNHSFSQIIENGKIKQIVSNVKDVTEAKNAQAQLVESEERWNFALEGSGHGVWDYNPQTNSVFLSRKWKEIFGYEQNEVKNESSEWIDRLHPDDKQKTIQEIKNLIDGKIPAYVKKYRLKSKDGTYKVILSQGKTVTTAPDGKASRVIGTILDVTEHQKAKKALKESEEKFSAAFYSSGAALAISRLDDGLILEVNDCFLDIFGYKREEVVGKTSQELKLFADFNERKKIVNLTLNNQPVINIEVRGFRKNKSEITALFSTKIFELKGERHLLTTLIDISNLKKVEKALFLRTKEIENFFTMAPDAVTITDTNGKIIESNELSWNVFGYSRDEILGMYVKDLIVEKDLQRIERWLAEALKDKQVHTSIFTGKHRNGSEIRLEGSVKAIFDQQGKPTAFIAINRDITARALTEKKLQESEERYRFVAEHAQDLITVTDKNGLFHYVSPSIMQLTGFEPAEFVGKKDVFNFIHSEDQQLVRDTSKRLLENKEPSPIEIRFQTKNGSYIWLEANISTVKDSNGSYKFISISRDVTQRRIDREERIRALEWAELLLNKLSVVGGFVRHDVRNKLAVITGTVYLCKKYANANGNHFMLDHIAQIEQAAKNIERILEFSQTYEVAGSQGLSWYSMNKAFEEAKSLTPNLNNIELSAENIDFEVLADSAIVEIFHNLIDNSIKYGKNLSQIKIFSQKNQNQNVELIYEDNGGGIDPQIKPQLFQKGAGKGTGLGLYLIQRICEIYGWQISEKGTQGQGVRFVLEIPKEKIQQK
jgi:PAS domain S-box-containing protein